MTSDALSRIPAPVSAGNMAEAAAAFIGALSSSERGITCFPFEGEERFRWQYTPGQRKGFRLKEMTRAQRAAALALFDVGLSLRGARQARQIIDLETILAETERLTGEINDHDRDPELYYFSIFGDPGGTAPWAWRANGHHLLLHFTVVGGDVVAPTPLFFGANPAEVRHGHARGLRILAEEEDLARALLATLSPSQQAIAVVNSATPGDIVTRNYPAADPGAIPRGITFSALDGQQRTRLMGLVRHYTDRVAGDLSGNSLRRIEAAGLEAVTFAWAGGLDRGQPHYYSVKGSTFLVEYDNSQNNANHIHSVWRDFTNDWGLDVLADHYAADH